MSIIPINLAVEDRLSEAVLKRILSDLDRPFAVGTTHNRGGYGYLKRTVRGWNRAAAGIPFMVLTDLDTAYTCPRQLIEDWLPDPQHPNLLFRVAVREVEAWLLADKVNFANFLRVSPKLIPSNIEDLIDPKTVLVRVARKSRSRDIRDRLVPKPNSTAQQGPDYNACLIEFVSSAWDIRAASLECASLLKTVLKLRSFTPVWQHA